MKKGYLGDIRPMTHLGGSVKKESAARPSSELREEREVYEEPEYREPSRKGPGENTPSHLSWGKIAGFIVLGLLVIGGGLYGLSFLFHGATVIVTPKQLTGTVDITLTASQSEDKALHYEVMTIPEVRTKEIPATNTETGKMKASGSVVIYNFQTVSQDLVATTRFADPSGKVFRLQSSVTIPKKTVSAGKDVPGQVTATLVADVGGEEGNIPLSDFTIVAFKGTAKEKTVYGRGKTAFSGGTSGTVYSLSDAEYKAASAELATQVNGQLQEDALKQVPENYMILPDSLQFLPDTDANSKNNPSQTSTVTVTYSGKERAILIKKDELAQELLKAIPGSEGIDPNQITILGEDKLVYATSTDITKELVPSDVTFKVTGDVIAVWKIDQQAVQNLLAGKKRSAFSSEMESVTGVSSAELVLRPFWMSVLPSDPAKITVTVKQATN